MPNNHDPSQNTKSSVVSSGKRDPKKALDYWTKEEINKAKPIPLPNPDVTKSQWQKQLLLCLLLGRLQR